MKISEMNTGRAFECMARMAPHVVEIMSDPQLAKAKQRIMSARDGASNEAGAAGATGMTAGDLMTAVYPLLMDTHREAMLNIAAALGGKTLEEVREQPLGETMELMREGFTGELFDMFPIVMRMVLSA